MQLPEEEYNEIENFQEKLYAAIERNKPKTPKTKVVHNPYGNLFGEKGKDTKTPSVLGEDGLPEMAKRVIVEPPSVALSHLEPARFDDETWEQYKERRKENNDYVRQYLKRGVMFWDSMKQGTFVKRR